MEVTSLFDWLEANWRDVLVAGIIGLASFIVLMAGRRILLRWWLRQLVAIGNWLGNGYPFDTLTVASLAWVSLLSAYFAFQFAPAPDPWLDIAAKVLLSGFILSTGASAARFARRLAHLVGERYRTRHQAVELIGAVPTGALVIVTALGVLQTWGAPMAPLLLAAGVAGVALIVAFRDYFPTFVASMQVAARGVEVGRYVRIGSGDEGTVTNLSWRDVTIRTVDGDSIHVPSVAMVRQTVQTFAQRVHVAREPFHFFTRNQLRELTGMRARNLTELASHLRNLPASSMYYHTHQYLEEHQYLTPTPANAFAAWVSENLRNDVVAEELAAVDVIGMATTDAARERLTGILQEAIDRGEDRRSAPPGEEFYFVKTVTFVIPLRHIATDLRELAAVVRNLPPSSLYFHLFESRLLSDHPDDTNLSQWVRDSVGNTELAREIDRLNPYDYTQEGLRSSLTRLIENRLA